MSDAATGQAAGPAIEVFYSYAQEDEALCIELNKHLNLLQRQGLIHGWQRRSISAGSGAQRVPSPVPSSNPSRHSSAST